jgi:hypothetical protein
MPSNDGLWLKDFQPIQHLGSQPIESGEHQTIDIADSHSLRRSTPQHIELVSQDEDFGLQRPARPK